ncbi:MAG: threonine synthase, partial [Myxococcota bacterium]
MRYSSTGGDDAGRLPSEALRRGLAADGGLYVPNALPRLEAGGKVAHLPTEAARFLAPFFEGDPLSASLEDICQEAFDFPCPRLPLESGDDCLELFHGPTAAFKDFGARFVAACSARMPRREEEGTGPRTVIVATSGDTGGAVAAAFADQPQHQVFVLYPEGRVSPRQEQQLTCWPRGVRAFAVAGAFDDCQRVVKEAFARPELRASWNLTSANSINIGRLLPQAAYMWFAARRRQAETGQPLRPIIPTGNLGHGLAAVWARAVGAPIGDVTLALNANRAVLDALESGQAASREVVPTLANAMDVAVPSNLERLQHLFPTREELARSVDAESVADADIETCIRQAEDRWGFIPCPHTACALVARDRRGPAS